MRLRRAIVVLMSGQGQSVRAITSLMQVSEDYVRDVIHAFNERGFDALDPKPDSCPGRAGHGLAGCLAGSHGVGDAGQLFGDRPEAALDGLVVGLPAGFDQCRVAPRLEEPAGPVVLAAGRGGVGRGAQGG